MYAKVMEVEAVCFHIQKSNPAILTIGAIGKVPTTGWTDAMLIPWLYVQPPADGIQDFDFVAKAPTGTVLTVVTPISAKWQGSKVNWISGVRVHASAGPKDVKFSDESRMANSIEVVAGGEIPWPFLA